MSIRNKQAVRDMKRRSRCVGNHLLPIVGLAQVNSSNLKGTL
jgi:hypothetical protein